MKNRTTNAGSLISQHTSGALRGVAILIVIASHYAGWMFVVPTHPLAQARIATWGPPGVDIFLLLSGYGLYQSAERERERSGGSGITGFFLLKRLFATVVPYLLIVGGINIFAGIWRQAAAEGTLAETLKGYLIAADYWYMQVLFVLYAAFMLCFRFGGMLRLPLIAAATIGYTVWLYNTGHADFWELSNLAFPIGALAAAVERRFPASAKKRLFLQVTLLAAGFVGMLVAYRGMKENGGSGVSESFGWEFALNIFFSLVVLALAWLLPARKCRVLATIGEVSLFIYLLHTAVFWALIFRFETWHYAKAAAATGLVTLLAATALGIFYNRLTGWMLRKFSA